MSAKLFTRSIFHSDGTLTEVCMRETVQQLIEQCSMFIEEGDVLYNTMTCRTQQHYFYYRSKLIAPSSTVHMLNNLTSDSDSLLMSRASTSVYNMLQGMLIIILYCHSLSIVLLLLL